MKKIIARAQNKQTTKGSEKEIIFEKWYQFLLEVTRQKWTERNLTALLRHIHCVFEARIGTQVKSTGNL